MSFSPNLIAYTDLGLFLAVIGVYVFFSALWLIYTLTERKVEGGTLTDQRIEQLRLETMREIAEANNKRDQFAQEMNQLASTQASREEVAQLRAELTTVREIAVLSGKRVRTLQADLKSLRESMEQHVMEFDDHIVEMHECDTEAVVDGTTSESIPMVAATETHDEISAPTLSLYNPVVEATVSEEVDASSYDQERGLVYDQRPGTSDNLTRIWGVGAINQELLNENGVFYFSQIAKWTDENIAKFNDILCFSGRIEREDWVGQAQRLMVMEEQGAAGDNDAVRKAA